MSKKNDDIDYLDVTYAENDKPRTDFPFKLAKHIVNKFNLEENNKILDVGCGTGSLLDAVKNISKSQVGIEPCQPYLDSIIEKGYEAYSSIQDCANKGREKYFDFGFSIQVIGQRARRERFPNLPMGAALGFCRRCFRFLDERQG